MTTVVVILAALLEGPAAEGDVAWRNSREDSLRAEDSWLTVIGLHWLREGSTTLGSDPANDIVLPEGGPPELGVLALRNGEAHLELAEGAHATVGGEEFTAGIIRDDAAGKADVISVGRFRLILLKRGERWALRLKDSQSPARAAFTGLSWFPFSDSWRIVGRLEPHPIPRKLVFDTIVGGREELESPGVVVFEREGREYRLEAAREGDHLWIVFRDATSGRSTATNARQLEVDLPDASGHVSLDFNRAINLPCSYTPHATCPIAPPQNRLPLAIEAGEKRYETAQP